MDNLFLQVLNMSITASYVILVVIVARLLFKKRLRFSPMRSGLWFYLDL